MAPLHWYAMTGQRQTGSWPTPSQQGEVKAGCRPSVGHGQSDKDETREAQVQGQVCPGLARSQPRSSAAKDVGSVAGRRHSSLPSHRGFLSLVESAWLRSLSQLDCKLHCTEIFATTEGKALPVAQSTGDGLAGGRGVTALHTMCIGRIQRTCWLLLGAVG